MAQTVLMDELSGDAVAMAARLLGCRLIRQINGRRLVGTIVETEAYNQTDAASHSYHGRTKRTDVMFGPAGHLYVYFTYGMHYCCNVVVGPEGYGAAVLVRALEPLEGMELMAQNRYKGSQAGTSQNLCNGPAKFAQAFGIDKQLNGHDLTWPPLELELQPALEKTRIVQTTRVGISQAADQPWRFYVKGNASVSRH